MNPRGPRQDEEKEKSLWSQCWLLRAQPLDVTPEKVAFQSHTVQQAGSVMGCGTLLVVAVPIHVHRAGTQCGQGPSRDPPVSSSLYEP